MFTNSFVTDCSLSSSGHDFSFLSTESSFTAVGEDQDMADEFSGISSECDEELEL